LAKSIKFAYLDGNVSKILNNLSQNKCDLSIDIGANFGQDLLATPHELD